jgi:hypothetical protein
VLDGILTYYDGYKHADAIAMAPYFNPEGATLTDLNSVLTTLAARAAQVGQVCAGDMAKAKQYNLRPLCYESGLDVWMLSDQMQLDVRWNARMKDIYTTYWNAWKAAGGQLMMQYTFCDPRWGLLRYQNQDTLQAYGWLAANEFIAKNPRWWTEPQLVCNSGVQPAGHAAAAVPVSRLRLDVGYSGGLPVVNLTYTAASGTPVVSVVDLMGSRIPTIGHVLVPVSGGTVTGQWRLGTTSQPSAPGALLVRARVGEQTVEKMVMLAR